MTTNIVLQGRVIQKEVEVSADTILTTAYCFDLFDRLAYVIPPNAYKLFTPARAFIFDTEVDSKEGLYVYKFDRKGQQIQKRIPGQTDFEITIFDKLYRKVLSRDAQDDHVLDAFGRNRFKFQKYDAIDRPVMARSRATHNIFMKNLLIFSLLAIKVSVSGQINPIGKTVETRFNLPPNYQRLSADKDSFGEYLRNFPLKNDKAKVYFYNGEEKTNSQQVAVLDIDRGKQDLQQCADAVMRLRAEYLYNQQRIQEISFKTFGGIAMNYGKFKKGYRLSNQGFTKTKGQDNSREGFRKYLDMVFSYANTYTLEKEMKIVRNLKDLQIGDVFIVSNPKSYGHAMIVMDVAKNPQTKDKVFCWLKVICPPKTFTSSRIQKEEFGIV